MMTDARLIVPNRKIVVPSLFGLGISSEVRGRMEKRITDLACDHPPQGVCKTAPSVSPCLIVPSLTQDAPGHTHLRTMTPMTFCEAHQGHVAPEELLTDKMKAYLEGVAKKTRPHDFKCDFGFAAHIDYTSIFSQGYQRFIETLAVGRQGAPSDLWQAVA